MLLLTLQSFTFVSKRTKSSWYKGLWNCIGNTCTSGVHLWHNTLTYWSQLAPWPCQEEVNWGFKVSLAKDSATRAEQHGPLIHCLTRMTWTKQISIPYQICMDLILKPVRQTLSWRRSKKKYCMTLQTSSSNRRWSRLASVRSSTSISFLMEGQLVEGQPQQQLQLTWWSPTTWSTSRVCKQLMMP